MGRTGAAGCAVHSFTWQEHPSRGPSLRAVLYARRSTGALCRMEHLDGANCLGGGSTATVGKGQTEA